MNIYLNISDLAIITGDNKFKSIDEFTQILIKKYFPEKLVGNGADIEPDNLKKLVKGCVANGIDISTELKNISDAKNVKELTEHKKILNDKMNSISDDKIKKEMKKCVDNVSNTTFGTNNEDDVLKICEKMFDRKIIKDNFYKRVCIYEDKENGIKWFIGGRIDGIDENGSIYEIKNRIHKLFYDLREYEKVQLMSYLYLFGCNKGYLVECLKNNNNALNIIEVNYDNNYFDKHIMDKLILYIIHFEQIIFGKK